MLFCGSKVAIMASGRRATRTLPRRADSRMSASHAPSQEPIIEK